MSKVPPDARSSVIETEVSPSDEEELAAINNR